MTLPIKWIKQAIEQLDKAHEYIEQDLLADAEKVKQDILLHIYSLTAHS